MTDATCGKLPGWMPVAALIECCRPTVGANALKNRTMPHLATSTFRSHVVRNRFETLKFFPPSPNFSNVLLGPFTLAHVTRRPLQNPQSSRLCSSDKPNSPGGLAVSARLDQINPAAVARPASTPYRTTGSLAERSLCLGHWPRQYQRDRRKPADQAVVARYRLVADILFAIPECLLLQTCTRRIVEGSERGGGLISASCHLDLVA
jgi:hypothetical protein